jgi:putative transcriptional regulator
MTKSAYDKIAVGLGDVSRYLDGDSDGFDVHIPETVDVKGIRRRLKLSQPKFADAFGFSVGRIRDWEQGRFDADAPSRAFLEVIDKEPEAVFRALGVRQPAAKTNAKSKERKRA